MLNYLKLYNSFPFLAAQLQPGISTWCGLLLACPKHKTSHIYIRILWNFVPIFLLLIENLMALGFHRMRVPGMIK